MAHLLASLRLLLIFPAAAAFAVVSLLPPFVLAGILLTAIASDYLDGRVARARGTASADGQLFDHATDCVFVTACLTGAALAGDAPWLLPPLIAAAFLQYVLDSRYFQQRKSLRMSAIGRWNGIFYFVPLVLIAAARMIEPLSPFLHQTTTLLCYALILSTLTSIADRALTSGNRPETRNSG